MQLNRTGETVHQYIRRKTCRGNNGCLLWIGRSKRRPGWFQFPGIKEHSAPRAVYVLMKGSISKGMLIRHRCDNPRCVRKRHLSQGTSKQNRRDFMKRNPRAAIIIFNWIKAAGKGSRKHWMLMNKEEREKFIQKRRKIQKKKYPNGSILRKSASSKATKKYWQEYRRARHESRYL